VQQFLEQYQLEIGFKDALSNLSNFFQEGSLFRASASIFQGFFSFITTIVIAFYMVVQGRGLRPLLQYIVPPQHLPYARQLFDKIENVMGRWLWAQVILMLTVGLLTYLGLRLLGVPNAGALATLAGILEVIPFIGPILSAMPAVIIAFVQSPALGIGVILLYIIVQQIENHVLVPKVMQKTVGTNPIAVILGILIGFRLAGVAGAVVAVPLIAIVTVIMRDMLERRGIVLEDAGPQAAPQ
jgi:predicted PurR-regulated permease PerM